MLMLTASELRRNYERGVEAASLYAGLGSYTVVIRLHVDKWTHGHVFEGRVAAAVLYRNFTDTHV